MGSPHDHPGPRKSESSLSFFLPLCHLVVLGRTMFFLDPETCKYLRLFLSSPSLERLQLYLHLRQQEDAKRTRRLCLYSTKLSFCRDCRNQKSSLGRTHTRELLGKSALSLSPSASFERPDTSRSARPERKERQRHRKKKIYSTHLLKHLKKYICRERDASSCLRGLSS